MYGTIVVRREGPEASNVGSRKACRWSFALPLVIPLLVDFRTHHGQPVGKLGGNREAPRKMQLTVVHLLANGHRCDRNLNFQHALVTSS